MTIWLPQFCLSVLDQPEQAERPKVEWLGRRDLTIMLTNISTGGPPLTQKSLTRFPLTRFLAYVRVSGGISVSRGPQYSPTNTVFSKSQNARKAGTLCSIKSEI